MSNHNIRVFVGVLLVGQLWSYNFVPEPSTSSSRPSATSSCSRRNALGTILVSSAAFMSQSCSVSAAQPVGETLEQSINLLVESSEVLGSLLDNWEKATVDCIYADIPRELLETKNKEQLLDKASTFALFDKSVSVVSCKKSNKIVRDYIGATGKGPLVGADKRVLKRQLLDRVDPDMLDDYITEAEAFSQSLAKATSLSYTAGVADFDSVNNFEKGKESGKVSNLDDTKTAIGEAKASLDIIVKLLSSS